MPRPPGPSDPTLPESSEAEDTVPDLRSRLERQLRINQILIARAERDMDSQGSSFALFQNSILLENKVKERTAQLALVNEALRQEVLEHERAETRLKEAHARIHLILQSMPAILIELEDQNMVSGWNAAAESTFSLSQARLIGRPLESCGIHWDWERVRAGLIECRASGLMTTVTDLAYRSPDGRDGFLQMRICPIPGRGAQAGRVLLFGEDITDRRMLQAGLVEAQKLNAIGELAAGIAHEINTPTQYVGDNTLFLKKAFDDLLGLLSRLTTLRSEARIDSVDPALIAAFDAAMQEVDLDYLRDEVPTAIAETLEGVARVTTIVRAMKDFSHPGTGEKALTDLNQSIASTLTVARNEWKYVADLVTDLDPDLPPVPCLIGEFNQVILNLVINAAHAIAERLGVSSGAKGRITVSTRRDGDWVEMRISDTGAGIPEAIRGRIFNPFFTTKEVGKGTGQGLAIAHRVVVKRHGGSIDFESETGRGTTFIVRLPMGMDVPAPVS